MAARSLVVGLFAVILATVTGQTDITTCDFSGKSDTDKTFPDIFELAEGFSYELKAVVSYKNLRQTSYFTEYYDIINRRGRVDKIVEGNRQTFLYLYETKEAFTIKDRICTVQDVKELPPFEEDMTWGWVDYEKDQAVLGPSAILRHAFLNKGNMTYMGDKETVRGMNALKWRQCIGEEMTVDYYFSNPQWGEPYGFKKNIPLRVTVSGHSPEEGEALPQTYEFVAFQPYLSHLQLMEVPGGFGCQRLDNIQNPPVFNTDFDVYGEVVFVYRNVKEDSSSDYWKYINNFRITYDLRSQHLSYQHSPWIPTKGARDEKKTDEALFDVYDFRHNVSYIYNDLLRCSIQRITETSPQPQIILPVKSVTPIDLLDPVIFTGNTGFEYLGTNTLRGYPVDVYERVLNDTKEGSDEDFRNYKVIITRSFLQNYTYYADGRNTLNPPVQVKIVYLDATTKRMSHVITINLYAFTTSVKNKPHRFDVRPCFPAGGVRFVIGFTGSSKEITRAQQVESEIVEEILSTLYMKGVSPVRLQEAMVDFDKTHIYVSALLMDRPDFRKDYNEVGSYKFLTDTEESNAKDEEDCAYQCLGRFETCRGYSFCSGKCIITTSRISAKERNRNCVARLRNSDLPPLPSLEELKKELTILVNQNQINVVLENPDKPDEQPIFLQATSLKFLQ